MPSTKAPSSNPAFCVWNAFGEYVCQKGGLAAATAPYPASAGPQQPAALSYEMFADAPVKPGHPDAVDSKSSLGFHEATVMASKKTQAAAGTKEGFCGCGGPLPGPPLGLS